MSLLVPQSQTQPRAVGSLQGRTALLRRAAGFDEQELSYLISSGADRLPEPKLETK